MQGGWLCSLPHDMILGKMKQCGAQANAARCISHRSTLQRASQRTAFVASPFCHARSIRYAKTIHPTHCIRPFTFERPRSKIPKSRKRLKREMHCIARPHRSPSAWNAHRPWPTEEGVSSLFPKQAPQKPRQRASPPTKSLKKAAGRMIGPEEPFGLVLGSQWHISNN